MVNLLINIVSFETPAENVGGDGCCNSRWVGELILDPEVPPTVQTCVKLFTTIP